MYSESARMREFDRYRGIAHLSIVAVAMGLSGCASGATSAWSRWSMTRDQGIAKGISDEEYANAKGSKERFGPLGVVDYLRGKDKSQSTTNAAEVAADSLKRTTSRDNWKLQQVQADPETEAEFEGAEKAFQQGQFSAAKKTFAKLAKRRKGTPFGESAQFYVAECAFQNSDFVTAHNAYEQLVADYPGTRYLDRVVEREYAISRQWLAAAGMNVPNRAEENSVSMTPGAFRDKGPQLMTPAVPGSEPAKPADTKDRDDGVKKVSTDDSSAGAGSEVKIATDLPVPLEKMPWYARLSGLLPSVDVRGHAFAALEHVRHHDPTGPLADDATLLLADAYFQAQDYETSSVYYDQFLSDFPKSPMFREAQEKAILAKINSYIGPEYDAQSLEKARELIQQTLANYPDRPREEQKKLYRMLDLITDQEAERAYMVGDYYKRTGKAMGAEFYFGKVIQKYPNSVWAEKARVQMVEVAKMPRKFSAPSKIMTQPGAADPLSINRGSSGAPTQMSGPNGMLGP
ncbi:outer membrane protein assembly factor BamD [bacterium]|nr:outer membrane protein assembly factor BamD [bacterium]